MPSIRKMMRAGLLVVAAALLLSACGGPQAVRPEMEVTARALLAQGRYQEAANEYLRLSAESRPPASDEFAVKAAAALVDAGDLAGARQVLSERLGAEPGPSARAGRDVLLARIALADRDPQGALDRLPPGAERGAGAALERLVRELRIEAYDALGRHLDVAAERVALDPLLKTTEERDRNAFAIWQAVSRLSPAELLQARLPPPDVLGGWLELATIANRAMTDPSTFAAELARWRLSFPAHPAETAVIPELQRLAEAATTRPSHVALLLPLHGSFAAAGRVVRDGFMAAWYDDGANGQQRPVVSVHDSAETDVTALYRQVVAEGADFVVGPLRKAAVTALAQLDDLPVPLLALNYAEAVNAGEATAADAVTPGGSVSTGLAVANDGTTMPTGEPMPALGEPVASSSGEQAADRPLVAAPFYQFALAPEDEARAAAERAWFDGAGRAALITPASPLGARIADAFAERWEELGGLLVARGTYEDDARDLSGPVKSLLNIDRSEERLKRLREVIGRGVKHETRRRQDVDIIMMTGSPTQARQLKPQINFHRAASLPVYATSHVYGAVNDPPRDKDIDGVRFGDMPWVLPEAGRDLALRQQMARAFPSTAGPLSRLHAFGVDAYRLIPNLGRLRVQSFAKVAGATGDLSVDEGNRVQRKLVWAQFIEGQARLLDSGSGLLP